MALEIGGECFTNRYARTDAADGTRSQIIVVVTDATKDREGGLLLFGRRKVHPHDGQAIKRKRSLAVVRMTTQTPARVLGIEDRAGSLGVGMPADVSVLKATEGEYQLTDTTGVSRVGDLALEPVVTLKAGVICPASSGTHE